MTETITNLSLEETVAEEKMIASLTEEEKKPWTGLRRWSSKGFLALLDQGLISGANFIMAILLARELLPEQYGSYALAFETLMLLCVVYGALVLEPMSVFGPSIYRNSLREYFGLLLRAHGFAVVGMVLVLGGSAWILGQLSKGYSLPSALWGVTIAAPCILLFWLARRAFYVKLSPRQAVLGAVVYSAVVLGGLLIVSDYGMLSPFVAFLLMATGSAATALVMLARLKPSLGPKTAGWRASEVLRRHWGYGRWALAGALAIWFSRAVFYPLVSIFRGFDDAGALKALMNFYTPVGQAFAAVSLLSLPYAARIHHKGDTGRSRRLVWKLTVIYAGGPALYWLVIILLRHPIVEHLYAGKYLGILGLLPWVGLGSVLRISATAQAVTLRAMHSPSLVFVAYAAASLLAVLIGVPCTWAFGLRGAVVALVLSNGLAFAVMLIIVHRGSDWVPFIKRRQGQSSVTMPRA